MVNVIPMDPNNSEGAPLPEPTPEPDAALPEATTDTPPKRTIRSFIRRLRIWERVRPFLVVAALLGAAAILLVETNEHERIDRWLFWPYAGLCGLTLIWSFACLSVGHALLALTVKLQLPPRERLVFDFAVGTLTFAVGLFVAGLFGLLRGPFYIIYPSLLAVAGSPSLLRYLRRVLRHWRAARRRTSLRPSLMHTAALVLGTLGLAMIYLGIMIPDNTAFDARTYHLTMAEGWAAGGRIGSFPEGWVAGLLPHLASWLYTWPFTIAPFGLFMRIELAAHMEFALFLVTLAATPLLVEALVPRRRAGGSWALYFLFPGIFLYDSGLHSAADHVLAFWAVPLALATRRVLGSWRPGRVVLLGLMMAGAALTKYQAVSLLVPVILVLLFDVVRQFVRRRGHRMRYLLTGPGILTAAALVASAPHWLANVIWHGNPVYPMLGKFFPSHPWVNGWNGPTMDGGWQPEGTLAARLWETARAIFTFSFVPHDWPNFHRDVPVFGFLFTLTLLALPFVRGGRRVWLLAGGASLGVFIWYWTFHQDRYLQALLPWMVACTAATLMLAWSVNRWTRIGATVLVALQLIWGGDVAFLPTHAMMGEVPARRAMHLLSSTYRGEWDSRLRFGTGFDDIAKDLPKKAVVLLHEEYLRMGMGRPVVGDSARWQGGIHYPVLRRPDRIYDLLRSYGVTHIVWSTSQSVNREIPVSGELIFFDFIFHYTEQHRYINGFGVANMPSVRPPAKEPGSVLYLGCQTQRDMPLTEIDATVAGDGGSPSAKDEEAKARFNKLAEQVRYVVIRERCQNEVPSTVQQSFMCVPRWGDVTLWVRR